MDEFDHRREFVMANTGIAAGTGGKQHQCRAHALAAGGNDVLRDLAHQYHIRMQSLTNDGVHGVHVGGNRGVQAGDVHGGFEVCWAKGAMLGGSQTPSTRCRESKPCQCFDHDNRVTTHIHRMGLLQTASGSQIGFPVY
jgi:hypothetical protein